MRRQFDTAGHRCLYGRKRDRARSDEEAIASATAEDEENDRESSRFLAHADVAMAKVETVVDMVNATVSALSESYGKLLNPGAYPVESGPVMARLRRWCERELSLARTDSTWRHEIEMLVSRGNSIRSASDWLFDQMRPATRCTPGRVSVENLEERKERHVVECARLGREAERVRLDPRNTHRVKFLVQCDRVMGDIVAIRRASYTY
jgi:hypothetical protein